MAQYIYKYKDNGSLTWKILNKSKRETISRTLNTPSSGKALADVVEKFVKNKWNAQTEEEKDNFEALYEKEFIKEEKGAVSYSQCVAFDKLCTQPILLNIFLYMGGTVETLLFLAFIRKGTMQMLSYQEIYEWFCKIYYPKYSRVLQVPYTWKGYWEYLCIQTLKKTRIEYVAPLVLPCALPCSPPLKKIAVEWITDKNEYYYVVHDANGISIYNDRRVKVFEDHDCVHFSMDTTANEELVYEQRKGTLKCVLLSGKCIREFKTKKMEKDWIYTNRTIFAWDNEIQCLKKLKLGEDWTKYEQNKGTSTVKDLNIKAIYEKGIILSNDKENAVNIYEGKLGKRLGKIENVTAFDADENTLTVYNADTKRIEFYDCTNLVK